MWCLLHLDRETLRRILTEPKNALVKQYAKLFSMEGITLHFEDEVLDFIVDQAMTYKLGARGLRAICESIMTDAMFDLPSQKDVKEFTLSLDYAKDKFEKSSMSLLRSVA